MNSAKMDEPAGVGRFGYLLLASLFAAAVGSGMIWLADGDSGLARRIVVGVGVALTVLSITMLRYLMFSSISR